MFIAEFEKTALSGDTLLRAIRKSGKVIPQFLDEMLSGVANVDAMNPGRAWARELIAKNRFQTAARLAEQGQAALHASEELMRSMTM